jgi:hypothetical protein
LGDRCEWFTIENDSSVVCVDWFMH